MVVVVQGKITIDFVVHHILSKRFWEAVMGKDMYFLNEITASFYRLYLRFVMT